MLNRLCARLVGCALLVVVGACGRDVVAPSPSNPLLSSRGAANVIEPLPDGDLVSITFFINHAVCGGPAEFSFLLNDVEVGTSAATTGCSCNTEEPSVTLTGPAVRAAWNARKGAANIIAVRTTGSSLYVGYIRVVIETVNGS